MLDSAKDSLMRNQLLNLISSAKLQAYSQHTPIVICKTRDHLGCNGNWEDGLLLFQNKEKDGIVHDKNEIIRVLESFNHGHLYFRSFPYYRNYLLFLSDGYSSDNGTFWHCHQTKVQWAISVSKTGLTHSLFPDENGEIKDGNNHVLTC